MPPVRHAAGRMRAASGVLLAAIVAVCCTAMWVAPGRERTAALEGVALARANYVVNDGTASLATARAELARRNNGFGEGCGQGGCGSSSSAQTVAADGTVAEAVASSRGLGGDSLRAEAAEKQTSTALSATWAQKWVANYGSDDGDEEARDTDNALTFIAKKRLSLTAIAHEVSQMKQEIAQVGAGNIPQHPQQMLGAGSEHRLRHQVTEQARELKAEKQEIGFLKDAISAKKLPKGESFVSYVGKTLASAGYTGGRSEEATLKAERKKLAEGWAALNTKKAARAAHKQTEDAEFASISQRLQDLEKHEELDRTMAASRRGDHEEKMKVSQTCLVRRAFLPAAHRRIPALLLLLRLL